jgi:hypothetical protein
MRDGPPKLVAIDHDDYHAEYVGRTTGDRQFFLTTPFEPALGASAGCEFIALYLFDNGGRLLEAKIERLGPRATMDYEKREAIRDHWLQELRTVNFGRIEVAPFAIQRFGTTFGLVLREPDEAGDSWAVEVQPGNFMAFSAPWDSGEYDT